MKTFIGYTIVRLCDGCKLPNFTDAYDYFDHNIGNDGHNFFITKKFANAYLKNLKQNLKQSCTRENAPISKLRVAKVTINY